MTDQKPDPSELTPPTHDGSPTPEPEGLDSALDQTEGAETPEGDETMAGPLDDVATDVQAETDLETAAFGEAVPGTVAETEAEAADAAAVGAAWTTMPVAPDPEATEAALAALAAKPEMTLESPAALPGDDGEPLDEGTPVLLVGGILVGAFLVALAIVLIVFRPFDSPSDVDPSASPSPIVTAAPSASPSAIATVDTPNFQRLSLEDAESTADDYGLVLRITQVETDQFEPNTVISQDPAPGESVEVGATIELSVAAPMPTSPVPDLVGLSQDEAIDAIEEAGFTVGDITEETSDTVPAGDVIGTDPEVDTELAPGSEISLIVSLGPETTAVPDLVDLTEADALAALEAADLLPGDVTETTSDDITAGNVVSSDPAADAEVTRGSEVDYVLSLGPETTAVPDLVDLTEADALAALEAADLLPGDVTETTSDDITAGNVVSSDPAADAEVTRGSEVDYVLSLGPETTAVPDLVDLTEADALAALEAADLLPGDVTETTSDDITAGNVVSSDPAADAEVTRGSEVDYVLSLGPPTTAVPDLAGPADQAAATLVDAGLVAGEVTEAYSDTVPAGDVSGQDPAPDTEVELGSPVAYTVSLGIEQVTVPDLVGLTLAEAEPIVAEAGLALETSDVETNEAAPGTVLAQDPEPDDRVDIGSGLTLQVAVAPPTTAVPDLAGPADQAAATLVDAGLVAGEVTEAYSDTVPAGDVSGQDPAPDTEVELGSPVAYTVSLGIEQVTVPDLVGLTLAEAEPIVAEAGLALETSDVETNEAAPGTVLAQDPEPDDRVDIGSGLTLQVAVAPPTTAVPDLAGPADQAAATLVDAGLVAGEVTEAYSDTVPAGDVSGQDPAPDTEVELGSPVAYTVSLGIEQVTVPDLVGLTLAEAEPIVAEAGLALETSDVETNEAAPGTVLAQDPEPDDRVDIGSGLTLQVAVAPPTTAVPDLAGPADQAAATLVDAGLVAGEVTEAYSDTVPAGDVSGQDPAPDTEVELGSPVAYTVSLGIEQVTVPDLVGLTLAEAEPIVADAGLALETSDVETNEAAPGTVLAQDPEPDDRVDIGSGLTLQVAVAPPTTAVPDLAGPADQAAATLVDAGLVAGEVTEAYSDTVPAGDVSGQDPAPDTEVELGSPVAYTVSLGIEQVTVPDLVGLTLAEAEPIVADAGLALETSDVETNEAAPGTVLAQDPEPDDRVDIGSGLTLQVAVAPPTTAVPDLAGPADQAAATLVDAGLVAGEVTEAYSDTVPAGDVSGQDPAPDTEVELGSPVAYTVSLGIEQVTVPDLVGLTLAEAEPIVADAGLALETSDVETNEAAPGTVLAQDPEPDDRVDIGSGLTLQVAVAPPTTAVPDLAGPADQAAATLVDAGLVAGEVTEAYSDTVPAGDVSGQDPAPDTEVELGSPVAYTVSLGIEQVTVPDLVGLTLAEAEPIVADAGLALETSDVETNEAAPGTVLAQDPEPDDRVDIGSGLTLQVAVAPPTTAVPDLAGPADQAAATLVDAGLVAGEVTEAYSDTVPAGDVSGQDPAPDTEVELGSPVAYTVSLGIEQVTVPDLVGLTLAEAEPIVAEAGLALETSDVETNEAAPGTVLAQDPEPDDRVDIGSGLTLQVAVAPPTTAVPDLAGPADQAAATLVDAGLVAGDVTEAYSDTVPAGDVSGQDPAPDTEVELGSPVAYTVSLGIEQVTVPDLVGLTLAEAESAIAEANLQVGAVDIADDAAPVDTVLSQDPAADSEIDQGAAVNLIVSSGPSSVEVPQVKDLPEAEAVAAITDAGLVVATTEQKTNATVPAGNAVKTVPAAGETVAPGTPVTLTVSRGPKQAVVPDLVGLTLAEAESAIAEANLQVGAVDIADDAATVDTVLSQDPAADSEIDQGAAVNLIVSSGPSSVEVPQVKDLPEAEAVAAITDAGLVVATTEQKTNATVPAGNAVKTVPAAGETVAPGTPVTLTVSRGPKQAVVPDLVGLTLAEAESAIAEANLQVGAVDIADDAATVDTVLSQDPAADSEIDQGAAVNLIVSSGPSSVEVPQVKDLPEAEAVAAITDAGLVVATTEQKTNATVPAGNAVKTVPAAGETVAPGTPVTLTVSRGPKQAVVPDLVGLTLAEAESAIAEANLQVGAVDIADDAAPVDTVLSQDPAADSEIDQGAAVNLIVSSGPSSVEVPQVKDQSAAEAQAALQDIGLVVEVQERTNATVPAGNAVKTDPAAGTDVGVGSTVILTVSRGPKQVTVPSIVGLLEADALAALEAAELVAGERSEANDESVAQGVVLSQDPTEGTTLDKDGSVAYTVSLGPVAEPRGEGGSLDNAEVAAQLDAVAFAVPKIRELELGDTPYDAVSAAEQADTLRGRADRLYDPATITQQEQALKRLGLLTSGDDLAALLGQLYGQDLPVAYLEDSGHQSVVASIDKLDVAQRTEAAREFGQAAAFQSFGSDAANSGDPGNADESLAAIALEEGDGTASMLQWAADNVTSGNQSKADDVIVPGDDGIYASMPPLLQREYSLPFLEGRLFVDRLRGSGGWTAVNAAWERLPETTEQILHPQLYPNERPTTLVLDGLGGTLGKGWKERWQQTMGELRIAVWLADGQPGTQQGPKAPVKLPEANSAAGWGGDRLVSLDGPDGAWAIVWQTKWDTPEDIGQFMSSAQSAIADLPGAHVVLEVDVSSGASNPALVLLTSDEESLAFVAESLGLGDVTAAS